MDSEDYIEGKFENLNVWYKITVINGYLGDKKVVAVERFKLKSIYECMKRVAVVAVSGRSGADPGFFSGGGALVSCSTSTPINHIVFFLQNTSCIRKPQVISGGGAHPLHPPPRSAPAVGRGSTVLHVSAISTY